MSNSQFSSPTVDHPSWPIHYPHLLILLATSEQSITKLQIQDTLMMLFSYEMHNSTFFRCISELQRWELGVCENPKTRFKKDRKYTVTPDGYELAKEFLMALNQLPYGYSGSA